MDRKFSLNAIARRLAGAVAVASLLGAAVPASAAPPAQPQHVIKDPHYGDGLFHFFQDQYFESLTSLMVSQHFDRVAQHADEAEILRGGLLLSYGLHREAGQIFAQLIERGAPPKVQDRAWFYLAKIRYQRGFLADAAAALDRIGGALPPALEEERGLLRANVMLASGDDAGAAKVLAAIPPTSGAGLYARYNLGVALLRSGETERGTKVLDEVGRLSATKAFAGEEFRALRDKANVALGFAALKDERPQDARNYLERVRLNGPQSNKALLGFGWAAAAQKQPKLALVPWTELGGRDASDAAVLEARIALPYALAELGAYGQSLDRYNEALAAFAQEGKALDESIAAVRGGKLMNALLDSNPGQEMGWFWTLKALPELPHASHLAPLMAGHEFQEAFKNYRDLRFLAGNLQSWQDKLGVFGDMLANRRQAFAERLPKVREQAKDSGLPALQQRRESLAGELVKAETDADGVAFANPQQRAQKTRIDDAGQNLKAATATLPAPEAADAAERLRRVSGALTWQLAQQHPEKFWDAKRALAATDTALAEATQRDAALAKAQVEEPLRFEKFAARIAELDRRIKALNPRVAALSREQQRQVEDIAVAELRQQQERLAVYGTQARFAVAQLQDRATQNKSDEHAAKQ
ncbi:hypothetical protein [Rivibacter subsaxonicus]|uniref:Tetratricopeptide repeat protein n=1 Tax=Rivibacter subsaxonicus TaxID=457575 RepID=A0A4V2FUN9_9BURK|nr:hypothetical protein [Rivibacter subsaxonicus]RZU02796.1 hypothetical protein EV670_0825 [Rivibacter subsaxonicus]